MESVFCLSDNSSRYPIPKNEYNQKTGRLLAHRIGQIFEKLGYKSWICKGQKNGVDLRVYDRADKLILVAEIINWSCRSGMPEKRKGWIIQTLSEYSVNKLFIYTAIANEDILETLRIYDIDTLRIGFQILPKYFYLHFQKKDQVEKRRIDSEETSAFIESLIIKYMRPKQN